MIKTLAGLFLFVPVTVVGLVVAILIGAAIHPASPWPQSMQTTFYIAFGAFQWLYVLPIAMWFGRRNAAPVAFGLIAGGAIVTLGSAIALLALVLSR